MLEQRQSDADSTAGDIEQFLQDAIQRLEPDNAEAGRLKPGRPRILPSLCLWAALLVCVLRGFTSQHALWRRLAQSGFWFYPRFPVTDQAVYKRLALGGTAVLEKLFHQISQILHDRLAPYVQTHLAPFATEVMALDETSLDPIARLLPALRDAPAGAPQLLPGNLAGLFDIRRQQWRKVCYIADVNQSEKTAAREMVAGLPLLSLILADLGYFGFAWFDYLTTAGYYWISRVRQKTSYTIKHVYYQQGVTFDGLIMLGAYQSHKAAHAVRLVCFSVGSTTYRYITNVLDPTVLSMQDIAALYARRWDFELAVKMIKRHLNLHLLWSAKMVVILQQVWAVLIIAQILHALQMEIAGRAGVDPFDVSLQLLVEYAPQYAYEGKNVVTIFVEQGRELGFIRPSTRTRVRAPTIPLDEIVPCPPDLVLVRSPRYGRPKQSI